jgi:uncharacterized protein
MSATPRYQEGSERKRSSVPRVRSRWFLAAFSLASLILLVTAYTWSRSESETPIAHGSHAELMGHTSLDSRLSGTYRLPSGDYLTLHGTSTAPIYELMGVRTTLRSTGSDTFIARDGGGDTLALRRGADGVAETIRLERPGHEPIEAVRDMLYAEEDVRFSSHGATLAGNLLLPTGSGTHPAVVLVHGAGPDSRENYRLLASHLARNGVAALIYDKRGVGESTGTFATATFTDLADDALAGVSFLKGHANVDARHIGLWGISQGGWVIVDAAGRSDDVAFLIPVSAPGVTPAIQDRWLNGNILVHRDLGSAAVNASSKAWRMLFSTTQLVEQGLMAPMPEVPGFWFHALDLHFDATSRWQQVTQPVLGIWGALDCQVPALDSAKGFQAAFVSSGHTQYDLRVIPGADHGIGLVGPCVQETTAWSVTRFAYPGGYFEMTADWIKERALGVPVAGELQMPEPSDYTGLAWHQTPTASVSWFGSFVPQILAILGFIAAFTTLTLSWVVAAIVRLLRRRSVCGSVASSMIMVTAVCGLMGTFVTVVALVELLILGDPHGAFFWGGPALFGLSPVFLLARVLIMLTVALCAAQFVVAVRENRVTPIGRGVAIQTFGLSAVVLLFAGWAAYWNVLPVTLGGA